VTAYHVLVTARFVGPDGQETLADSRHLVDGVATAEEAELQARREAVDDGVDVVAVHAVDEWRRRGSDQKRP
jgi:hypothetical protein